MRGNSSHEHNPFVVLRRPNADERQGEVIGISLVYSGNFRLQAEVDAHDTLRLLAGIDPETFEWKLESGESFQTPEAVMVYTDRGLNHMSQTFHKLYQRRLARGYWRDRVRPILNNNWEATYFDFTEERLVEIASKAKECGVELLFWTTGGLAQEAATGPVWETGRPTGKGCPTASPGWRSGSRLGLWATKRPSWRRFPGTSTRTTRLHTAIRRFSGSLFLTAAHYQRMERMKVRQGYRRRRDTPAYYAAMYLLTANEDICTRAANCFCRYGIEFDYATTQDISPHNYTLLSAAKDIYSDGSSVALNDLAISEVVDTLAFSLIVNALLVARYGPAVLAIKERSRK